MSKPRTEGQKIESEILAPLEVVSKENFDFLEKLMGEVTLLNDKSVFPYEKAKISLVRHDLNDLVPCSLYLLSSQLETIRMLAKQFDAVGVDIFELDQNSCLVDYCWGSNERHRIYPPLVERSEADGGIYIICDGLHRESVAKELGRRNMVVLEIENASVPLPVLPTNRDEIAIWDEVPPSHLKRRFRYPEGHRWEKYKLFRDLP